MMGEVVDPEKEIIVTFGALCAEYGYDDIKGEAEAREYIAAIKSTAARSALMQAARAIRVALATSEVSKAEQGRMKYAIGFLEASAEEYKNV